MMQAVLSNAGHPEYGVATIPFPIPRGQFDHCIELVETLEIQQRTTARVSTTQSSAVTAAQNAVTYFPEFNYEGFWRLLDCSVSGKRSTFTFKDNPYSTYDRPTHFTPIWYPDGSYTPYTWLLDCWTPAGMLSVNLTDSVRISGDLWEEWHVAPSK